MKQVFTLTVLVFLLLQAAAQTYIPVDAARDGLRTSQNPAKRFQAMR